MHLSALLRLAAARRICPLQDFSAAQRGQEQAASRPPRHVQLSGRTHAPGAAHRACAPSHVAAFRAERVKSHGRRAPGRVVLSASLRPAGTRDRLLLLRSGSTRDASRTSRHPPAGPRAGRRAKPRLSTDNEIVAASGRRGARPRGGRRAGHSTEAPPRAPLALLLAHAVVPAPPLNGPVAL